MEIETKMTLLISETGATIELHDCASSTTFFRGEIDANAFCAALGRLARVPIKKSEVFGLDKIGKKMQMDKLEFLMPIFNNYKDRVEVAREAALRVCPDGWTPDLGFSSQGSFFNKDGEEWARTTIRRWE